MKDYNTRPIILATRPEFGCDVDLRGKRVWVAGHRGMVGAAICRRLAIEDCTVLTVNREHVDLRRQVDVENWMANQRPDYVFIAAATVGGIYANSTRPAEFIYDNLMIEANIIEASRQSGVNKLLFLGSSCIYPRDASQPMSEGALLSGQLEPTNQWYAIAKISGIKLCQAYRRQYGCDYISAMPTNLYGPYDNFDPLNSHVLPALILKIHCAKLAGNPSVKIWGTGTPRREFLHCDDLADALVFLFKHYSEESHVNVGTGSDVSIREAAELLAKIIGFTGGFDFDTSKPDGAPSKLLDVSLLKQVGWRARIGLRDGLTHAYQWFLEHPSQHKAP
ncbi:MAG: GDP-L-fucose synthase [Rhodospirillaceae bacterium]